MTGMSCAACSARVEKAVSSVEGVTSCSVSLLTNSMGVEGTADPSAIIKAIEDAGYGEYYMHGLGHSIGIQVPRGPRFNQWDTTPVFSDLIMTVEPGIYLPGEFGVRIEDMLYIGEKQVQNMTHSTHELIIV